MEMDPPAAVAKTELVYLFFHFLFFVPFSYANKKNIELSELSSCGVMFFITWEIVDLNLFNCGRCCGIVELKKMHKHTFNTIITLLLVFMTHDEHHRFVDT